MSTARERLRERKQIMGEIMINHPVIKPLDPKNVFSAWDVAVYPQECAHDIKEAAVKRTDKMLKTLRCLVPQRLLNGTSGYLRARSPVLDPEGLLICKGCIFHDGDERSIIPMPCPDEVKAVKRKGEQTPITRIVPTEEPKQLPLF